jgi:Na+-transporting methylmalonyl-CoA/oxaloacetate decarboxylase gamma subunit
MSTTAVVAIVVIVVLVAAVVMWMMSRRRRSAELRERFGPEYERTVQRYGDGARAEEDLAARAGRVEQLHIRQLPPEQAARYAEAWRSTQSRFVDDPEIAVAEADRLVAEVMQARGYPMTDFEQRAADISVDHPSEVEHFRAGHALAVRAARGEATTEDLRQTMVHYRVLFDDLIDVREPVRMEERP